MTTLRVMMRPMDNSAFFIPDILAVEVDTVAYIESVDSPGDVDVMRDQQRLSRRKLNDESFGVANRLNRSPERESPCPRLGPVRRWPYSQMRDQWSRRRAIPYAVQWLDRDWSTRRK